MGFPLTPRSMT